MGFKEFIKHQVLGIPESYGTHLRVELPSEEEKRKTQQIKILHEKVRDMGIESRKLRKEIQKQKKKKEEDKGEKKLIKAVLEKSAKETKRESKKKVIYKLIYPNKPFIQYANGQRRYFDGFEINETKDGTPLFRLRFYSPELKKVLPLQLDAQEITFFFKNIIGLVTQYHTGLIPLNVDEIDGKPVFIESEIDFLRSRDLMLARLTKRLAIKDSELKKVRGDVGAMNELQAEQEKDLADNDMAVRYAKKDSENKSAKLESVMRVHSEVMDDARTTNIQKHQTELKMAQAKRTAFTLMESNETLHNRLQEAFSSDAYELGKKDTLDVMERNTKNILSIQSATKQISQSPVPVRIKEQPKKIEKK